MSRILIVEDDKSLASGLVMALSSQGHSCQHVADGEQGLHMARTTTPDLVILDIMMPHLNGFEVIAALRVDAAVPPILVLSARSATNDKVRGLDLGADDYLAKPFELDELFARVRRLLRIAPLGELRFGMHTYNFDKRLLYGQSQDKVVLSTKEQLLLEYLLRRDERIVTRESILNAVWGDEYDGTDRTIDNIVVSLRRKIGETHIETVRGQGYRFVMNP